MSLGRSPRKPWQRALLLMLLGGVCLTSMLLLAAPVAATARTADDRPPSSAAAVRTVLSPSPFRASPQEEGPAITYSEVAGGGATNNVIAQNKQDVNTRVRGNIQLNRINGPDVQPQNFAGVVSSCTDCKTMAVALQINLYRPSPTTFAPTNEAVAVNVDCTRCLTVARALQYVIPVGDPAQVPDNVKELIREMDRELTRTAQDANQGAITFDQANARIDAVIARFQDLAAYLTVRQDQEATPDATGQ